MFQIKQALLAVIALTVISDTFAKDHPIIKPRIVQGRDAERGQFPYYAFLEMHYESLRKSICGGSLISTEWILTAAHCLRNATSVKVFLGSVKAWEKREPGRKVINVTEASNLILHPDYSSHVFNDIGLIKLPSPVEYTKSIQPVPLACSSTSGMDVIAIGNGFTGDDKSLPLSLQYTGLKTLELLNCIREYPFLLFISSVICVNGDGESLQSICKGDSGGSLVAKSDGKLVGLSSFVSKSGCEHGLPQGFTRVSAHLDWIKQVTGVECKNKLKEEPVKANSRHELEQWLCRLHNKVNERTEKAHFDCSRVKDRWDVAWKVKDN